MIEAKRIQLKDGLTKIIIKQILENLTQKKIMNSEESEAIQEENSTRADQARALIDSVVKKGPTACQTMVATIKDCDVSLYNNLALGS